MTDVERAERRILGLLNKRDWLPSALRKHLSDSFDDVTIREALLNLVTRQKTRWKSGRRLSLR